MAGMIVFDGKSLESVANVKIEDVRVSPIDYDPVTRPRAIRGGSEFVRNRAGTRTVAITFALLDDNKVSRQAQLLAISEWAKTDKEYRLDLPGHPNRFLMCVCTAKPEPTTISTESRHSL
jgi:phage-related protein